MQRSAALEPPIGSSAFLLAKVLAGDLRNSQHHPALQIAAIHQLARPAYQ